MKHSYESVFLLGAFNFFVQCSLLTQTAHALNASDATAEFSAHSKQLMKDVELLGTSVSRMKKVSKNLADVAISCGKQYKVKKIEQDAEGSKQRLQKNMGKAVESYFDLGGSLNELQEEIETLSKQMSTSKSGKPAGSGMVCEGSEKSFADFYSKVSDVTFEKGNEIIQSGNEGALPPRDFLPVNRKTSGLYDAIMLVVDGIEKGEKEFYEEFEKEKNKAMHDGVNKALRDLKRGVAPPGPNGDWDLFKYKIGKVFASDYTEEKAREKAMERAKEIAAREAPKQLLLKCQGKDPRAIFKAEKQKVFLVAEHYKKLIDSVKKLNQASIKQVSFYQGRLKNCSAVASAPKP